LNTDEEKKNTTHKAKQDETKDDDRANKPKQADTKAKNGNRATKPKQANTKAKDGNRAANTKQANTKANDGNRAANTKKDAHPRGGKLRGDECRGDKCDVKSPVKRKLDLVEKLVKAIRDEDHAAELVKQAEANLQAAKQHLSEAQDCAKRLKKALTQ
jgi:hypothetical protein